MTILKKRRLEILRSVHLFKIVFCFLSLALLVGMVKPIKDKYLFRLSDKVVGLHDLEEAQQDLSSLQCIFPDSLVGAYTGDAFRNKLKATIVILSQSEKPLSQDNNSIIFLSSVRSLWKLFVYVESQDVNLNQDLENQIMREKGCPHTSSRGKMRDSFRRWLRVEVYLRSRYAPTGIGRTTEWLSKRQQSITQFVDSLDKQLPHENFW